MTGLRLHDGAPTARPGGRAQSDNPSSLVAVLLLLASIGFITAVDTTAKVLTVELHATQIVWGYFLGITCCLFSYLAARRTPLRRALRTSRPLAQIARSGFLASSITFLFIGLTYLPIADATAINFMAPLFITALSGPFLGERVGPHRWIAVLLGLGGMIYILRPGGDLYHWSALVTLLGAACFAVFQIMTRKLSSSDSTVTTLSYTAIGGLLWTSLVMLPFWQWPEAAHWVIFLCIGLLGLLAHLCMISAFARAQASLLAPFNYSKLLWAIVAGYLVFDHIPSVETLLGSVVIIASGLYVLYRENRAQARVRTVGS